MLATAAPHCLPREGAEWFSLPYRGSFGSVGGRSEGSGWSIADSGRAAGTLWRVQP